VPETLLPPGFPTTGYDFERELGGAGMSRVYLARETSLGRRVVVKSLCPEVAGAMSVERFALEVRAAATVQHANIVPLLTTGTEGGMPWYSMPYVEGESLRQRLERGPLPLPELIPILRDVARALAAAHQHGIVHRDIKPENILLSGGVALVADFGVARALRDATAGSSVWQTSQGMTMGTPAYMAPEQAAADPQLDHRADLYSLGLVAWEMCTGTHPFVGRSPQEMMSDQLARPVPPLAEVAPHVPSALARLVERLLAKRAADRPSTAQVVLDTLAEQFTTGGAPASRLDARPPAAVRVVGWSVAALLILVAAAVTWQWRSVLAGTAVVPDDRVLAVAPFRTTGADVSLAYLREGAVDLLGPTLAGDRETRVVEAGAFLSAWRSAGGSDSADPALETIREAARRLGAGQLVTGTVTGTARQLVLRATLRSTRAGEAPLADAQVSGPQDSLAVLVSRLATQLLAARAGESGDRQRIFAATPFVALQHYLAGRAAFRRGAYADATEDFLSALDADSSFALAGMAAHHAASWTQDPRRTALAARVWPYRSRLGLADSLALVGWLGPEYPAPFTARQRLEIREAWVRAAPGNPDALYLLGDTYLHEGPLIGMAGAETRALAAFERAFAADSSFIPAAEHLPELLAARGDTAAARRVLAHRRAASPRNPFVRLDELLLTAPGDSAGARALIADVATDAPVPAATQIALVVASHGEARRWMSEALMQAMAPRIVSEDDRRAWQRASVLLAGARRDTAEVARLLASGALSAELQPEVVAMAAVGGAPRAFADALVPRMVAALPAAPNTADVAGRWDAIVAALTVRAFVQRDRAMLSRLSGWLVPHAGDTPTGRLPRTLLLLAQQADAALAGTPNRGALESVDALLADPYFGLGFRHEAASWLAAQLWAAAGDPSRAVACLQRVQASRSLALVAARERDVARWAATLPSSAKSATATR
jgi:eukaryotic-like serine/threonine-protein kinase